MLFGSVLILALLGSAQPMKFYSKPEQQPPPPPPPQPEMEYYQSPLIAPMPTGLLSPQPLYREPVRQEQIQGTKGGYVQQQTVEQAPLPSYQPPQALAYVIIRPIQPQYQYLEPIRYNRPIYPTPIRPVLPVYRGPAADVKGQPAPTQQEQYQEEQQQEQLPVEQVQEQPPQQPPEQPPQQQPPPEAYSKKGIFLGLKSYLDQAKAKLTLGSTYHVQSEEIVQPPPPPQPQQPVQQEQIGDEQIHEQKLEAFEQEPTRQQQQIKGTQQQIRPEEPVQATKTRRPLEVQQQQAIKSELPPRKEEQRQEQLNSEGQF